MKTKDFLNKATAYSEHNSLRLGQSMWNIASGQFGEIVVRRAVEDRVTLCDPFYNDNLIPDFIYALESAGLLEK